MKRFRIRQLIAHASHMWFCQPSDAVDFFEERGLGAIMQSEEALVVPPQSTVLFLCIQDASFTLVRCDGRYAEARLDVGTITVSDVEGEKAVFEGVGNYMDRYRFDCYAEATTITRKEQYA